MKTKLDYAMIDLLGNYLSPSLLVLCRDVDRRIVTLPEIRETGEYVAELKLHPEVTALVRLNVYAN